MFVTYEIKNIINGKRYVGSSGQFEKRRKRHMKDLRGNCHHSIFLQRAYNVHGKDSFVFNILNEYTNSEDMKRAEQQLLDNEKGEYNMSSQSSGGDNITNHPNYEEYLSRKKLEYQYQQMINGGIHPLRRDATPMLGESNHNWRGGISKHKCMDCEAIVLQQVFRCGACNKKNLKIIRLGESNHFYGKHHSEETKNKIRETKSKLTPKLPPNTRKVQIGDVVYESCSEAGRCIGISPSLMIYRLKSDKYPDYNYLD